MGERSGTLLERDVSRLFKLSGFEPKNNVIIEGYEIDIFVPIENYSIIIECKQYERSSLVVRNLIHQWDSKNRIINASRVLLVLVGCNVTQKDNQLAQKFGITIWNEKWLEHLMDLVIKDAHKARFEILASLNLNLMQPELDAISDILSSYATKIENDIGKAKTSDENVAAVNRLVHEGFGIIKEMLDKVQKLHNAGLDKKTVVELLEEMERDMVVHGISSLLHSSIFTSFENAIYDPSNKDKITKQQFKELKAYFKRTKKYLKKHYGTDAPMSLEEYKYIKNELNKLDQSGKLDDFSEVLDDIEKMLGYHDLIKVINNYQKEIAKVRKEIE